MKSSSGVCLTYLTCQSHGSILTNFQLVSNHQPILFNSKLYIQCHSCSSCSRLQFFRSSASDDSGWSSVYRISYMWYSFLGAFLTVFFGFIISLMTGGLTSLCGLPTTGADLPPLDRDESCAKSMNGSVNGKEKKARKSITSDGSIRIQIGAPMTMMMKTGVSCKSWKNTKDEGNIFAVEGYRNQAFESTADTDSTPVNPGRLALEVERGKF